MPYPAKTNRSDILEAALEVLASSPDGALSIRAVAARLGLAPNALYKYFPSRAALLAAIADHAARLVLAALVKGRGSEKKGDFSGGLRGVARAYLHFAAEHPNLYAVMMTKHETSGVITANETAGHDELWAFVLSLLTPMTGKKHAPHAAVATWCLLHGMVGLEAAELLGTKKPRAGMILGLEALLAGFARLG